LLFVLSGFGFLLSPPSFDLVVFPGRAVTKSIRITNVSRETLFIEVKKEDFVIDARGKVKWLEPGVYPFSCHEYVEVNPLSFTILPGEKKTVRFTVNLPQNARGEYSGVLVFRSVRLPKVWKPTVVLEGEVVCALYIKAANTVVKSGDIKNITYEGDTIFIEFSNEGNCRLKPSVTLTVWDGPEKVYEKKVEGETILRHSRRVFAFPFKKKGRFRVIARIDYGGLEILEGEREILVR